MDRNHALETCFWCLARIMVGVTMLSEASAERVSIAGRMRSGIRLWTLFAFRRFW